MKKWMVVSGCAFGMAMSVGPFFWLTFGLYMTPMTGEFGWSRTEFSFAYSAASVVNAVMLPIVGYFVDRHGPKRVILVGIVAGTLAYALFSQVDSYWSFVVIACLVAGTGCIASYPSYLAVLPRWFDRNLGLALALAGSGVGIGGVLFPYVINAGIGYGGWRSAFVYTALFALVLALINYFLLIRVNKGQLPHSEVKRRNEADDAPPVASVPFAAAVRTRDFWLYSVGFALILLVTMGISFHIGAMVSDAGGDPAHAAAALATIGMSTLIARVVTGFLLDRFSLRLVAVIFFLSQAIGCLLLATTGISALILVAVMLGAAQGVELDMLPYVVARRFGSAAYSQIFGSAYAVLAVGQIVSPIILGRVFDWTASYTVGFYLFACLSIVGLVLVLLARSKPDPAEAGADLPSAASPVSSR
ncbi:MFS family permease [Xanthomonas campestris]|uniref:MFS transporter n=1 Tax=Xanthomonas sp. CFBP 8151 TaxID=3035310 RepID=UPI00141B711C|nr:MFS transporter [Xanthomonas sp. CFBP 8151]MEB1611123.1 MFS transporter [Xanthomonas campestris pv. campestris]NIJ75556.1 MFS family permease [Xanthomonas sp. CFBP 8151]